MSTPGLQYYMEAIHLIELEGALSSTQVSSICNYVTKMNFRVFAAEKAYSLSTKDVISFDLVTIAPPFGVIILRA